MEYFILEGNFRTRLKFSYLIEIKYLNVSKNVCFLSTVCAMSLDHCKYLKNGPTEFVHFSHTKSWTLGPSSAAV